MDANRAARQLVASAAPLGQPLSAWPRLGAVLARHPAPAGAVLELAGPRAFYEVQRRDLGASGRPIGTLLQLHDVTERELAHHDAVRALAARDVELGRATALQALLREQAMHDPLTGLLNRRALDERWTQEARLGPPRALALVLLDLDRFKDINDTHGHTVGDAVLRDFAAALRSGLRAGDALFRVGGEEFALLMPESSRAIATERVEALRELVASWRLGGLQEPVTFSAGIAEAQPTRVTLDAMLAAADKALYRAKHAGRDRIEVALVED
jgi:diguanylate cyclase (GGDEF)-like protein